MENFATLIKSSIFDDWENKECEEEDKYDDSL